MNETELKPCPFCGGEKVRMVINLSYSEIWCEGCGARITRGLTMGKYDSFEDAKADFGVRALNAWNRRATDERAN